MPKQVAKTKPAGTHFIIMEMGDSYNDEITSILDTGTPVQVFDDEESAEKRRQELQFAKLRGLNVGEYVYDVSDLTRPRDAQSPVTLSCEEVRELLPFCNFPDDDNAVSDWEIPTTLSNEELAKVDALFPGIRFYTVVAV
jgi:hypothetical protein